MVIRTNYFSLLPLTNQALQQVIFIQNFHFITTLPSTIFHHLTHTSTTWYSQRTQERDLSRHQDPQEWGTPSGPSATFSVLVSFSPLSLCSMTFSGLFGLCGRSMAANSHWFLHPTFQITKERLSGFLLSFTYPEKDLDPYLDQVPQL